MARPSLFTHRKFTRLARLLGKRYRAVGVLEMVWAHAYQDGDDRLGTVEDLEFMVDWDGEPGECATALVESGFLDLVDGELFVHDLFDHAPDYVRKRRSREDERRSRSDTDRSLTGQRTDNGGQRPPKIGTPAPAPAPAPAPTSKQLDVAPIDFDSVAQAWDTLALSFGIPKIRLPLSKDRRASVTGRVREHGIEAVMEVLTKTIPDSPLLIGENDKGWRATFDWVFGPRNFVKVLEGNYLRRVPRTGGDAENSRLRALFPKELQ